MHPGECAQPHPTHNNLDNGLVKFTRKWQGVLLTLDQRFGKWTVKVYCGMSSRAYYWGSNYISCIAYNNIEQKWSTWKAASACPETDTTHLSDGVSAEYYGESTWQFNYTRCFI